MARRGKKKRRGEQAGNKPQPPLTEDQKRAMVASWNRLLYRKGLGVDRGRLR